MKTLYRHRQNISSKRCWFYQPSMNLEAWGKRGSGQENNEYKTNRQKLEPHIQKWNEKRETLCNRKPKDCIVNIHSLLDIIHQLNPSWATEKSLDLKKIKGAFNHSCMTVCSGCEQRVEKE